MEGPIEEDWGPKVATRTVSFKVSSEAYPWLQTTISHGLRLSSSAVTGSFKYQSPIESWTKQPCCHRAIWPKRSDSDIRNTFF